MGSWTSRSVVIPRRSPTRRCSASFNVCCSRPRAARSTGSSRVRSGSRPRSRGASPIRSRPRGTDQRAFEEAVRLARAPGPGLFTGLEAPAQVAAVQAVRRAAWVEGQRREPARALLESAATRITEAMARGRASREPGPPGESGAGAGQLQAVMGGKTDRSAHARDPSRTGARNARGAAGARGQYDIAVPRAGGGERMLFVVPNISNRSSATGACPRPSSGPRWRCTRSRTG